MRNRRYVAYVFLPVVAYLVVLFLVAVLYLDLPTLGWIGLGVVAAVSLGVAAGVTLLFPRIRTAADPRPAAPAGTRLVVLADARCTATELCAAVEPHARGEVLVVAPVLPSPLHYLTGAEEHERSQAEQRLAAVVERLEADGYEARGEVGADDPLQALGDALARFDASEVLIATPSTSHWLESDLVAGARRLAPHVEHVVV